MEFDTYNANVMQLVRRVEESVIEKFPFPYMEMKFIFVKDFYIYFTDYKLENYPWKNYQVGISYPYSKEDNMRNYVPILKNIIGRTDSGIDHRQMMRDANSLYYSRYSSDKCLSELRRIFENKNTIEALLTKFSHNLSNRWVMRDGYEVDVVLCRDWPEYSSGLPTTGHNDSLLTCIMELSSRDGTIYFHPPVTIYKKKKRKGKATRLCHFEPIKSFEYSSNNMIVFCKTNNSWMDEYAKYMPDSGHAYRYSLRVDIWNKNRVRNEDNWW